MKQNALLTIAALLLAPLAVRAELVEIRPKLVAENGSIGVEYRSGDALVARSSDAAPAGVELKIPGAEWHLELLQIAPGRQAWQFETAQPPLAFLRTVSRQWPRLTFLLVYDREDQRRQGLVKARNGRVWESWFTY